MAPVEMLDSREPGSLASDGVFGARAKSMSPDPFDSSIAPWPLQITGL